VHVNGDIADAVRRYVCATGDAEFERGPGVELLVETARLWDSIGHFDVAGCFRIDGVTGPDEYSALSDNNVFTNLMAARNLREAAAAVRRWPERARELAVDDAEVQRWTDAAGAMVVPFDADLGVTPQSDGFTRLRRWETDLAHGDVSPLMLRHPYFLLYSSQVVKQADLVFALYLFGEEFGEAQIRRDFAYYEALTVHDSSLSASIHAIVAAEVGELELAERYFARTAFVDLHDANGNTSDGVHLAALAGAWLVAVAGFGGMRDHGDRLRFAPRLPDRFTRLRFNLLYRGRRLRVEITREGVTYELADGDPLDIVHHGADVRLRAGAPVMMTPATT
jgi:alpha,alpha-trehalose phosphorylase